MFKELFFSLLIVLCSNSWAMDPVRDFLLNKGVGEASLRAIRSVEAPSRDAVEKDEPQLVLFSEDCGFTGCATKFLVIQKFSFGVIKTQAVAAIVSYDFLGQLNSIKVIEE